MTTSGIVVVNKPSGLTSHDVVHQLRKVFGTRKIGHAGTLDPMATGVLIVGVNSATRLLGHLALTTKQYSATIRLGAHSSTDDAEGEISLSVDTSGIPERDLRSACSHQVGSIMQVPSSMSAKRIAGRRAHELVRAGEEVELDAVPVHVDSIDIRDITRVGNWTDIDVEVACSTGTFIRAIARDVGNELKVGGFLTALRRTKVGPFAIEQSVDLGDLKNAEDPWLHVVDMGKVAQETWPCVVVASADRKKITYGQRLTSTGWTVAPTVGLLDEDGSLVALADVTSDGMDYLAVFIGGS